MNYDASIIVPCKGRLGHLSLTLSTMLDQEFAGTFEVVVVDYGCPDSTAAWVCGYDEAIRPGNLRCVQVVHNAQVFNLSRARNCGACSCQSKYLAFADADHMLRPDWLRTMVKLLHRKGAVLCRPKRMRGPCAALAVMWTDAFHAVRGYDESLQGWGHEDTDLHERLATVGQVVTYDAKAFVEPIPHDDLDSVRYYDSKDKLGSWRQNKRQAERRDRNGLMVNPSGYGQL